ncbi:MAG: Smr/MutS family protein, partial [Paracoccaceae bacterium]
VITGKGGKQKHLSDETEGYGVLRKQAPLWLASPPFKSKILQVHEAHLKHGGSGALYVYLTRNRAKT